MNIVSLNAGPKPPSDLSKTLREIADAVDRGEVTDFVGAYTNADTYRFVYGTSLSHSLVLVRLLDYECVERFKR